MSETYEIHPFERCGFGKAPFRFIGMEEKTYQACHGAPIQPGSSCDYCGQGIRYVFHITSADGNKFKVGGDCAATQLGKRTNTADKKLVDVVKREMNKRKRDLAKASASKRIETAKESLAGARATLEAKPHPTKSMADRGRTLADYAEWMFQNAGQAGKIKAARIVENELN